MMKIDILNRFTGKVQFTAEIDGRTRDKYKRIGLAVKWAIQFNADLRGADLSDAYLLGANLLGANLRGADLSDAYLLGADLLRANLLGANLRGADLRGADLRGADLRGADLSDADLSDADLSGANLRDAPIIEDIHKKVYEAASQPNALDMRDWHTCNTTHCRAGWVTTLAGEEGRKLEDQIGTPAAATLIYLKSDPKLDRVPDFYCDNDTALEDMKRLAEG